MNTEKMIQSESVPVQGRTVPSKKPSTYVFDSNGDTHLTLTTYRAQTFHWEEETVWLGLEGSKKKSLKEKKKGKKKVKKAAAAPLPPSAALLESAVPAQMLLRATTDLSLAESDDIRDEGKGELICTEPGMITTSPKPQVQRSDYGEKSGDLPDQVEIRMLVSGRHLALASSYFEKMFSGPFTEGKVDQSGLRRVTATDWDPEAFNIILTIIHGYHRDVPKSLSLEMLAKVAMIVDYYECHESVELHAKIWLENLKPEMPTAYGRDCILCMLLSWVFAESDMFQRMTRLALRHSERLIETQDIPLAADLLEQIYKARQASLMEISSALYNLESRLQGAECSYECSSMLLGILSKQRINLGMWGLWRLQPSDGSSIQSTKNSIDGIKVPHWYDSRSSRYTHSCTIQQKLLPDLEKVENELRVFNLQDFLFDKNHIRP